MTKKVLDVGQCGFDHRLIKRLIETSFHATVDQADTADEAIRMAKNAKYDLILVNRLLDIDHSPGIGLIDQLKSSDDTASIPVMLISNYPQAQAEAKSAGAVEGFGKSAIQDASTRSALDRYLKDE